jgi:hypothetical protein
MSATTAPCCAPRTAEQTLSHLRTFLERARGGWVQVMNVFLSQTPYGSPDFQDPLMCASCHINNQ